MKLDTMITERLSQLKLFATAPQAVEDTVEEFEQAWRALGRERLEAQLQQQVEAVEAGHQGARQRRTRYYQTPLGSIQLKRRVYGSKAGTCIADGALDLPSDGWMRRVKELAAALGVSSEFAHANHRLSRWSGIQVSEKTLANPVEDYGCQRIAHEAAPPFQEVCPMISTLTAAVHPASNCPML